MQDYTDAGLLVVIADDITIIGCLAQNNGFRGINPDNDGEGFGFDLIDIINLVVDNVEGTGNGPEPDVAAGGVLGNDLSVFNSENVVVRNSNFHDSIGGGLLIEDCVNALVENNRLADSELDANGEYWDGAIWVDGGHDVTVVGNIIEGNHGPGLVFSDEGVQKPYGYVADGNTVTGNLWGIYIWNFGVCPWPTDDILRVTGNTLSGNTNGNTYCNEWDCGVGKPCD